MIMTYNHKIEVSKLVQQWMPLISVLNDSDDAQKVIDRIKKNYGEFLDELYLSLSAKPFFVPILLVVR